MRMTLERVNRGIKATPWRMVLYGPGGIGKSSLAAEMPAPKFFDPRGGTDQIDCDRFPAPEVWEDVFDAIELLRAGGHEYKTLVIDELGRLEEMSQEHVRKKHGANIFIDYGKGFSKELEEWTRLTMALDRLRQDAGMNVCLIGHSVTAKLRNPEGEDYDRYSLKIYEKVASNLFEWADAWLFCRYETLLAEKGLKKIAVGDGTRLIHTQERPAFAAKNRFNMPEVIPLYWPTISSYIENPPNAADILAEVEAILPHLKEADANVAKTYIEKAGNDARKLAQVKTWCQAKAA